MKVEKNEFLASIVSDKKGSEYDVAVMYSGGKDSSYMLLLLKEVYNLRVLAVMVDNGFEYEGCVDDAGFFLNINNIDYHVICPDKNIMLSIYKSLITESDLYKKKGVNHFCFICNNLIWLNVMDYAYKHEIPYIATGLDVAQLESGRTKEHVIDQYANRVAEKSLKYIFTQAVISFNKSNLLNGSNIQDFISELNPANKKVKTIFPFLYHQVPVEGIKKELLNRGWKPPAGVDPRKYVSSGCMMMKYVIPELEKLGILEMSEREQVKAMYKKGLLSDEHIDYVLYDPRKEKLNFQSELFDKLCVKEALIECAEKMGSEYIS